MQSIVPGTSPMAEVIEAVNAHALNQLLSFEITGADGGVAHGSLAVTPSSSNLGEVLHGGALYTALDTVAAFAAVSSIEHGHNAVTHSINVSLLSAAPVGTVVQVEGRVLRAGRRLAFVHAQARVGDKLIAVAQVTKSVVRNG